MAGREIDEQTARGAGGASATAGLPPFQVAAVSLPGNGGAALPIAASRAGATGILDLSGVVEPECGLAVLQRLIEQGVPARCGVLLDPRNEAVAQAMVDALPMTFSLWLDGAAGATLHPWIRQIRQRVSRIGMVVTSAEQMRIAEGAHPDFLVVKGHECGGGIGEETSYVLAQEVLAASALPVWVWGGIGWHTAPACRVVGAAGVVLDWQLALLREAGIPAPLRNRIERMDGSETAVIRLGGRAQYRILSQPGFSAFPQLDHVARATPAGPEGEAALRSAYHALSENSRDNDRAWPVGQDACLAAAFRRRGQSVGQVLPAFFSAIDRSLDAILEADALRARSPMAEDQRTTFPIMQGPMTRVSDVPKFCHEVECAGGLPMLALGVLGKEPVKALLKETQELMGERSWGVGILGFVDAGLRAAQIEAIRDLSPPFAVIAGGRPDQAAELEALGIRTYLHAPSPAILETFLREGARRFIFEGMECGGHVGPRSSFVLWETMVDQMLEASLPPEEMQQIHLYFAGGIHDATSGLMAAAIAQPLIERGARFGVEMGTAYLFTHEAVATGAIVPTFQSMALGADETVLFESGPGHAIRCVRNACFDGFEQERTRLRRSDLPIPEMRERLEKRHQGRLRIASKGIARDPNGDAASRSGYRTLPEEDQRREGMYMVGQVAAMQQEVRSMAALHRMVCEESGKRLEALRQQPRPLSPPIHPRPQAPEALDIAIVGMGCLLPGAEDPETFWENIMARKDLISEIPPDRFDVSRWFDQDPKARDKIYSAWGGFIDDVAIDPLKYGIPPASIPSIEPAQLLALELVDRALLDAGSDGLGTVSRDAPHTSVILGAGGGMADLGAQYAMRALVPHYIDTPSEALMDQLPEWTEDSFAGILVNVVAGRVSNRFDLGGVNFTVDAACASSLAAVYLACRELAAGTSDRVVAGGCDTIQGPFAYLCFSKTGALSPTGKPRVFDEEADGITIGEGLAAVVLKRREDAERDGDRVYAVIRAVSGGSDGRCRSMTAPHVEGQLRTLKRAYAQARFSPTSVELFEAHGTGTSLGDRTECQSVSTLLRQSGAVPARHAVGSVKSMIGHTKCTAGVAGLIKSAMALYHRTLPPTLNVSTPNRDGDLAEGPLYVNTETRPWIASGTPRRAAVSAFGFGGTNFHAVLEEYTGDPLGADHRTGHVERPAELFFFSARAREDLCKRIGFTADSLRSALKAGAPLRMADLAYTHHIRRHVPDQANHRLAIVSPDADSLLSQLEGTAHALRDARQDAHLPRGVYYEDHDPVDAPQIAFLFPGQGSQFPNMMKELAIEFTEVNDVLSEANVLLADRYPNPLSQYIFPPPPFRPEETTEAGQRLAQTVITQPALGACSVAMLRLLESFGVRPQICAGHSYGELTALHAAGALRFDQLMELSWQRGDAMAGGTTRDQDSPAELGAMIAVAGDRRAVESALRGLDGVWVANTNSPLQTVISGRNDVMPTACERLQAHDLAATAIPVQCAFHTPMMARARDAFGTALQSASFSDPRLPVFSNTEAAPYPGPAAAIGAILLDQVIKPVRFVEEIEAIYRAGARVFIEVGPNQVLTRLVDRILGNHPHLAIATGSRGTGGFTEFLTGLGRLATSGYPVNLDRLYRGRPCSPVNLRALAANPRTPIPSHFWHVNSAYVRRADEPKRKPKPMVSMNPPPPTPSPADPSSHAVDPRPLATGGGLPVNQPPAASSDEVFLRAQETMRKFLETQEAILQAYFGEAPERAPREEMRLPPVPPPVRTMAPSPDVPEAPTPMPPPSEPTPRESSPAMELEATLVSIVAERTGYPPDMLELDADMEADLGIDSIKRVEIIAAFRHTALPDMVEPTPAFMEAVTGAGSMRQVVDAIREFTNGPVSTAPLPAPATPTVSSPVHPTPVDLEAKLTGIVSARTGYPADMLELEADMEADLGIDSIKRVEIIAAFRCVVVPEMTEPTPAFMDAVTAATTMADIVGAVRPFAEGPHRDGTEHSPAPTVLPEGRTPRCVVEAFEARHNGRPVSPPTQGTLLITEDDSGVAHSLRQKLHDVNTTAVVIPLRALRDPAALEVHIQAARKQHGRLVGAIHLAPACSAPAFPDGTPEEWRIFLETEVESLLYLGQALAPELSAQSNPKFLFAAISVGGGDFGAHDASVSHPWRGAIAGFMKCAAREWPAARICALDFDDVPNGEILPVLLAEWGESDPVEIGYRHNTRWGLRAIESPLPEQLPNAPDVELGPEDTLVVTGGARGITAEVVKELAQRTRARFILLARTPLPSGPEDPRTATCQTAAELRGVVAGQLRAAADAVTPKEVEDRVQSILRARDVRSTLTALAEAGSEVEYVPCDVSNHAEFRAVLTRIQSERGPVSGVIHGAGTIEDKYIVDKSAASFRRVVHTKVGPMLTLVEALDFSALKLLVVFSSVAGFVGNPGQSDYAAANEALNRLASALRRRGQFKVVSLNWGPWTGAGMVTPEVAGQFLDRGIDLISVEQGRRAAWEEICFPAAPDVRIVLGPGPWVEQVVRPTPSSPH